MPHLSYGWPKECSSIFNWLLCSWDFWRSEFKPNREWGYRVLGVVVSNYRQE